MGVPYEVTLDLRRGGKPFASVGERCGFRLTQLAASVTAAREDPALAVAWPDPDDRFPEPGQPGRDDRLPQPGQRGVVGQPGCPGFRPGEREYFSLRSRERSDLPGTGELRCVLRDSAQWLGGQRPGWNLTRRAVIEAWGPDGIGVRAVLTSAELVTFLDTVLREPGGAAVAGCASGAKATTAGIRLARLGKPSWRQRGRVRDGSTRSRLPALRAQNRSVAFASGDPQARRGDVRR